MYLFFSLNLKKMNLMMIGCGKFMKFKVILYLSMQSLSIETGLDG